MLAALTIFQRILDHLQPTGRNVWAIMPNSPRYFSALKIGLSQGHYTTMGANVIALNKSITLIFYVHVWALVAFASELFYSKCIHRVEIPISFSTHISIAAILFCNRLQC